MTKSEFIQTLEKNAQTYRKYGDNVSAEIVKSIIKIAHELDEPTEVPHD